MALCACVCKGATRTDTDKVGRDAGLRVRGPLLSLSRAGGGRSMVGERNAFMRVACPRPRPFCASPGRAQALVYGEQRELDHRVREQARRHACQCAHAQRVVTPPTCRTAWGPTGARVRGHRAAGARGAAARTLEQSAHALGAQRSARDSDWSVARRRASERPSQRRAPAARASSLGPAERCGACPTTVSFSGV